MHFALLGPLVITDDAGAPVAIDGLRVRVLLAALLLRANVPVPADALAEAVWEGSPPAGYAATLRSHVRRLRAVLGPLGADRIATCDPGYMIRVKEPELDLARFEALWRSADAAQHGGQWAEASDASARALRLWRAEPLLDVPSQPLRDQVLPWLGQLRMQLLECYAESLLRLGRYEDLVPQLRILTADHPLHERFHAQLMLALALAGQQAEALAAYTDARRVLVAQLGIEPGLELRRLHERILAGDDTLLAPRTAPHGPGQSAGTGPLAQHSQTEAQPVPPRELPSAVPDFTGRSGELQALTGLAARPGGQPAGAVVISAIGGTAGVGKTALAVHWAHQVADRFGDGQLYVNLRGFDPSGVPATPAEAIRGFLGALGVPSERIPARQDAQVSLYRSLLADKQMLIVLDNARDEQQVRPLLPASPASLVIVTSRNQLGGLAAAEGARLLNLDVLRHHEAIQLLSARIGDHRVAAEPEAADRIARLCAHLPLALAVAAARAAARPRFPLTQIAAELGDPAGRLDALDAGDPAASVAAVFSWSYQQLSNQAARMFRLLGVHPGPDISVRSAASLAAVHESHARRLLLGLARDCLITEHTPGRYVLHDLLRTYAASKARELDSQVDRDAALVRVLDHYLHTACHGLRLVSSGLMLSLAPPSPGSCPEQPADHRQAMAWFDAEHQVLLAAVTMAADTGVDGHAWKLSFAMSPYLYMKGYTQEGVAVLATALAAATRGDDLLGQALSHRNLGNAVAGTGDYERARAHLERSLLLFQRLGDRKGEALAQQSFSKLAELQGRFADALGHSEQMLRLIRAAGHQADKADQADEAEVLNLIGWYHALLGHHQQALAFCQQSLDLIASLDGCNFEYLVWDTLGYSEHHLGRFARAAEHFETALGLCRNHGNRYIEAEILTHLGDARHAAGELPQARQAWQQALAICDDIQHPDASRVRSKLTSTNS